jgi:hypothetical protein
MEYQWKSRLDRALSQRIFLMEAIVSNEEEFRFKIMGSTQTQYDLIIERERVYCSCPDHSGGRNLCKHLLFVLIRALGHSAQSVYDQYFQTHSFETSELTMAKCRLFLDRRSQGLIHLDAPVEASPRSVRPKVVAHPKPVVQVERKEIETEDDCPICYEQFSDTQGESLVWCQSSCGNNLHESCFLKWVAEASRKRTAVTCVYCRAEWRGIRRP